MAIDQKTILTRIINKNASLAEWNASDLVLKKGEIALAYVETLETTHKTVIAEDGTTSVEQIQTIVPTYLMKIGDGTNVFSSLKWLAAPASDVYPWAKKAALDFADLPEDVKTAVADVSSKLDADTYNTFIEDVFTPLKSTVDAFFADDAKIEGVVDTLVEIQNYLDTTDGAQSLIQQVATLYDWYEENNAKLATIQSWYDAHEAVLSGITSDKVSHWDEAYTNTHTHDNKDLLNTITSDNVHSHSNKTELDKIEDGDVAYWNSIEGTVAANYVQHSITTVEYLLDCGGCTERTSSTT